MSLRRTLRRSQGRALEDILARLDAAYDFDGWHWQPRTPPEHICIGAVLVQHTAWRNVERALERLRAAGACSLEAALGLPEEELAELVRPAGTPLTKARRLRALAQLADEHDGLDRLLALPADDLRPRLLATNGIGPETADAIILYAAGHPVFEVDAYTVRLFRRLGLGPDGDRYEAWQHWFEAALPPDVGTYRRYHGLIVLHGKQTCRPRPRCQDCCLLDMCPAGREATGHPHRGQPSPARPAGGGRPALADSLRPPHVLHAGHSGDPAASGHGLHHPARAGGGTRNDLTRRQTEGHALPHWRIGERKASP